MICVSIAQTSHRFAFVDMINASILADLIEIRLDRFEKPPDVKQLTEACTKPCLVSCRRKEDGGEWSRSEEGRMSLIRQAVLEGADYVEIELDVADQVRRYGKTKRVISFTDLTGVPRDIEDIYKECCNQDPDVIKLTLPARTPEEAWPVVKLMATGKVPTVAVGLGRNGIMLNILGCRYKAPWIHAALEKGMEAYPGMATISELEEIYDYDHIDSKTPLLALTGLEEEQRLAARVLNHCFRLAEKKTRCLPMELGNVELFSRIVKAIKLAGVVVDDRHREEVARIVTDPEETVQAAGAADFVAVKGEQWFGFNTVYRAVLGCMEDALRKKVGDEHPIQGRTFLVVGCSGTARSIAAGIKKRGGAAVIADHDNDRSQRVAEQLGIRFVPAGQVYTTMCDGLVLCPCDMKPQRGKAAVEVPKSMAREGLLVVDMTDFPYITPLLDEGRYLGGIIVKPIDIFVRMMHSILKASTGQSFTPQQIREPLADFDFDNLPGKEES